MSHQDYYHMSPAEVSLGKAMALIQRVLPRLDEGTHTEEVQSALRSAALCIENARQAHAGEPISLPASSEIVAVIAAAISTVLSSPYRLVSVQPVQKLTVPLPSTSAWAVEGRSQIFESHRIR